MECLKAWILYQDPAMLLLHMTSQRWVLIFHDFQKYFLLLSNFFVTKIKPNDQWSERAEEVFNDNLFENILLVLFNEPLN